MSLIKVSDFNISSISIGIPIKRHNNGYGSIINYNGQDIIIQTPLCKVEFIDTKEENIMVISFKLSNNFEHFQLFCSIHELIIKHLCRYSESENYEILTDTGSNHEQVRTKFVSYVTNCQRTTMQIKLKLLNKTSYFAKNTQLISGLEIKPGDTVVCIIKANQISMDSESATHTWDCLECLKWNN